METGALNESDLSAYCRERGLYPHQIHAWRAACEQANDWERRQTQRLQDPSRESGKRIKTLEKELLRKEKALAEVAALRVLQKKAQGIWGEAEDA